MRRNGLDEKSARWNNSATIWAMRMMREGPRVAMIGEQKGSYRVLTR